MKLSLCLAILATPLALAGCTPDEGNPRLTDLPPAPVEDPCGAARYGHLIGQTSPTISVPAGQMYRIYRSGEPVTLELLQNRLTFEVDKRGKLLSVTCS